MLVSTHLWQFLCLCGDYHQWCCITIHNIVFLHELQRERGVSAYAILYGYSDTLYGDYVVYFLFLLFLFFLPWEATDHCLPSPFSVHCILKWVCPFIAKNNCFVYHSCMYKCMLSCVLCLVTMHCVTPSPFHLYLFLSLCTLLSSVFFILYLLLSHRHLFYLQIKSLMAKGQLPVPVKEASKIGALIAQAEFGNSSSLKSKLCYPQFFKEWAPGTARSIAKEHSKLNGKHS